MLSRHNIRVKVAQSLYAHTQREDSTAVTAERNYLRSIEESYRLYLYNMQFLMLVADYAITDLDIQSRKYIKPEAGRLEKIEKLYNNPIIVAMRENLEFKAALKKHRLIYSIEKDIVRNLYQRFVQDEYYDSYVNLDKTPIKEHQYCLVKLFKVMMEYEPYMEHVDELFPSWYDDYSLVFGAIKRSLRSLPKEQNFFESQKSNPEFVYDFGKRLLNIAVENSDYLQELISDKLRNWKEDRIALMDMILLKMALSEFLYFDSIPPKVTINEYVSLAKDFSCDKSKRFINGILDRLMKDLRSQGKIQKSGRGLID